MFFLSIVSKGRKRKKFFRRFVMYFLTWKSMMKKAMNTQQSTILLMKLEDYYRDSYLHNVARLEKNLLLKIKETVKETPGKEVLLCYYPDKVVAFVKGNMGEVDGLRIRNGHMLVSFSGFLGKLFGEVPVKDVRFKDYGILTRNVVAAVKIPSSLESVMADLIGKPLRWAPLEKPFVLKECLGRINKGGYPDTFMFATDNGDRMDLTKKQLRLLHENLTAS